MNRRRYKYMKKKIDALGISQSNQEKIMRKIKQYYNFYKKNEANNKIVAELIKKYDVSELEANYINIVCRFMFMDDVIPVENLQSEKPKRVESPIVHFKSLNEWAEYKAYHARKIKDPEVYKFIIYNFMNYKPKELEKKIERKFNVDLWNGCVGQIWINYRKSVKGAY